MNQFHWRRTLTVHWDWHCFQRTSWRVFLTSYTEHYYGQPERIQKLNVFLPFCYLGIGIGTPIK